MTQKQKKLFGLSLGALGIVFGDIGTSPLYALRVLLNLSANSNNLTNQTVLVLVSLLIWTLTLVVSIKYLLFIMKVNNKGEGGIMAMVAMISAGSMRFKAPLIMIGIIGVALFYGDSVVTPAISVLSAVEGLEVVAPELSNIIVPITLFILAALFAAQRFGTNTIGKIFGPVMLVWFATIGLAGLANVIKSPDILAALSPLNAATFVIDNPLTAFISMGAIVLAVTGAEALYADMGHFGRKPIALSWFTLIFPSLILCYLGQAALILNDRSALSNPFFLMFPAYLRIPIIVLAAAATLIASQAVISGAFSLTKQAIQLNLLPRMLIKQTSARYVGQIYMPFVNFLLFGLVTLLVLLFGSSDKLSSAYGVAVSGALAVDSLLFIFIARTQWQKNIAYIGLYIGVFLSIDFILVAANITKISHGGWIPIVLAVVVVTAVNSWRTGQKFSAFERKRIEKPLQQFVAEALGKQKKEITRIPGAAIYIGHHVGFTPTALHSAIDVVKELHESIMIIYVQTANLAHVDPNDRVAVDSLGSKNDGISTITITYGFHDTPNIPKTLEGIRHITDELNINPKEAVYFISLSRIVVSKRHTMRSWQKSLYQIMSRNSLSSSDYYHLPVENTVEMRTLIKI
jgi:KUP system potassium uptake protein